MIRRPMLHPVPEVAASAEALAPGAAGKRPSPGTKSRQPHSGVIAGDTTSSGTTAKTGVAGTGASAGTAVIAQAAAIPGIVISDRNRIAQDPNVFLTQRAGKISQERHVVPVMGDDVPTPILQQGHSMQATRIVQKKRELNEVDIQLAKKRIDFKKRMDECAKKREELRTKQRQIRDRVLKFEKFLKENDSKRQRAVLKAQTERKSREQKEQELAQLQQVLRDYQARNEQFKQRLGKYQCCEDYLSAVVTALPADYLDMNEPHINDILMRHKTLTETNEDLRVISLANTTNIEREQLRQNDLIKSHNDNMLTSNSQLSTCQKRLDKMRTMTSTLEQRFDQKNQSGMLRMRALGETMLAIENLHARVLGSFVFLAQMKAAAGAVANVAITSQQQQQRVRAGATVRGRSRSSSKATTAELSRGNLDSATASLHSVNQLAEQAKTANDAVSHSLVPSTKDPSATASSTSKQDPHAAPTQPQHSTPRTTIPWPQKLIQIQNRVIDLTEIADKAQEFVVAAEKVKRADADKLMRVADTNGSGAKEEKLLEREKRRNVAQHQQPLKSSRNGTSSSNSGNGSAVQSMISELAV